MVVKLDFLLPVKNRNWKHMNSQSKGKHRDPKYNDGLPKEVGPAVQCIERYCGVGFKITIGKYEINLNKTLFKMEFVTGSTRSFLFVLPNITLQ
jgi:hypothetical protein